MSSKHSVTLKLPLANNAGKKTCNVVHFQNGEVSLVENTFGFLFDADKKSIAVKRFTWTNQQMMSVSVITFGARIISVKMPDRKGRIEELALGFDDLNGYLFYDKYKISATLGEHHIAGGNNGFDHVVWKPFVSGKTLTLSYLSSDGDDGYPGDVFVQIAFKLTKNSKFKVCITGNASKTMPLDITNFACLNLAGHNGGESELRNHQLTINAKSYTPMDKDNEFPIGTVENIFNTRFDFQTPKMLNNVMAPGMGTDASYNHNFCINRKMTQGETFVARLVHPGKGRVLEMYSNQHCVNFDNCCHIPDPHCKMPSDILLIKPSLTNLQLIKNQRVVVLICKLSQYFQKVLKLKCEQYRQFLRRLMNNLLSGDHFTGETSSCSSTIRSTFTSDSTFNVKSLSKPVELQFLQAIKEILPFVRIDTPFEGIMDTIHRIYKMKRNRHNRRTNSFVAPLLNKHLRFEPSFKAEDKNAAHCALCTKMHSKDLIDENIQKYACIAKKTCYNADMVVGRGGLAYERYGGFCLRTQGYPNATLAKNFPTSVKRPNEEYKHTITYKFSILSHKAVQLHNEPVQDFSNSVTASPTKSKVKFA